MRDDLYIDYNWHSNQPDSNLYLIKPLLKALKSFNINSNHQLLDVGCGNGHVLKSLYDKGFKNIWGFDLSKTGIDNAKELNGVIRDNITLHSSYNSELPETFPKEGFDFIYSLEVIEHLYDPYLYLSNIASWLKSDGVFVLSTPYHSYLKNLFISLLNHSDKHYDPTRVGGHIKFWSKKTIEMALSDSGFSATQFYGSGRFYPVWKSMLVASRKN